MSRLVYRGNLSAKSFPLITDFQGQTVIVSGQDNTFNRTITSERDLDKDAGIPCIFYCHNVLPAPYGFNSIGYQTLIPAVVGATSFTEVKILKSNNTAVNVAGPKYFFSPQPSGAHNIILLGGTTWGTIANSVPYTTGKNISYATCQGISYIFFEGIGCYKYNSATNTLIAVTLLGLVPANILGIVAYQGYVIAYDTKSIYWSSAIDIDPTLNAIDFVPSIITGAGSFTVEGTRSEITFALPATFGIAMYTKSNIVSGVYSANPRYPFNFKEVVASGGCTDPSYVAYDANTGNQYAYTTSGFQTVSTSATQTLFPELTDFLGGRDFEDFDETTRDFIQTVLTSPMKKRLTSVSDRYLIVSYGISSLTHAIVYDMAQERYGKLKVDHVDCFEYEYLDPAQSDAPRNSIAFLGANGQVQVVDPAITLAASKGVILLGKFQYDRGHLLTLENVTIQTVHPLQSASCYDLSTMTGGTITSTTESIGYEMSVSGESQRSYNFHVTGKNHSILIMGGFFLSSFVMVFHNNGRE